MYICTLYENLIRCACNKTNKRAARFVHFRMRVSLRLNCSRSLLPSQFLLTPLLTFREKASSLQV